MNSITHVLKEDQISDQNYYDLAPWYYVAYKGSPMGTQNQYEVENREESIDVSEICDLILTN